MKALRILKDIIVGLFWMTVILGSGYAFFTSELPWAKALKSKPEYAYLKKLPKPAVLLEKIPVERFINLKSDRSAKPASKEEAPPVSNPENMVTLYLKNGSAISGELAGETPTQYLVSWQGGLVSFMKSEVEKIDRKTVLPGMIQLNFQEPEKEWPYQNPVVIKLTNGEILDAAIKTATRSQVVTKQALEGGGFIEQDIDRKKVESLLFKPVENPESKKIEENLKKQFSKMKFYREGNVTLVTDSYKTWVDQYKKIIRQAYTDIYLDFFQLFKGKEQKVQNFVVVFDDRVDFIEYAFTDGVPGWMVLGYFAPDDEVLYLFNALGDSFSDYIKEAIVGQTGKAIDQVADQIKQQVDNRYGVFVDGQAQDVKDKFGSAYNLIRGQFRNMTESTLRHELTHEVFHNWGLQSIIISKIEKGNEQLLKKKKEYIETKDYKAKRKLLQEMLALRGDERDIEMNAANSWFAEGSATFCETPQAGDQNNRWLYIFQEMVRKGSVYPIAQLTVYKMGSFPGVYPLAMLDAYAQSWAFMHFLMNRYPDPLMVYLERMSKETPQEHEDLKWLEEAIGKNEKMLESEFLEYMKQFEPLEDPDIEMYNLFRQVFESF